MHHIIAGHRRRIARDARHHRRRCITSSPGIEEGSRAMLGIIAVDAPHHRPTSKKDRARCLASSPSMHPIIARHRRRNARDAWHHRRRCMTSSPDVEEGSRAMLGIIEGDVATLVP
jgi:hypothetical protein